MRKIVLIHGAWHNGRCWNEVSRLLKKAGYEVEALTLPGNGEGDSKDVSYEDYVNYIVRFLNAQKNKVIVVAHSSAGHILQMAVPKAKDKVEKIIFNNAWILPDGKSQFDFVPEEIKSNMRQLGAVTTLLSGSGSAVFGIMSSTKLASEAAEVLRQRFGYAWAAAFIGRDSYGDQGFKKC